MILEFSDLSRKRAVGIVVISSSRMLHAAPTRPQNLFLNPRTFLSGLREGFLSQTTSLGTE